MNHFSDKVSQLSSSKRLLLALREARAELEAAERRETEPIAIIGMSCRFPGGANDPEAFWQLLRDARDAVREIPAERWNIDAYYDPDPDASGKMYIRHGAFIDGVEEFDAYFFGISPREAISLDPQQRLLLEVSWEALERAGYAKPPVQTGIFVGIAQNDYTQRLGYSTDPLNEIHAGTGNGFSFASGRLSYTLGLQGPNMALDTACSSSLVALHLACQSLRLGECEMGLAGGVQLILAPSVTVALSRMRALSPDGRCKTFDAAANGYGRGEGCGMLVLKRLSDARRDGDQILALIRGSAVNHDGPSSGLTVPNKLAQEALIRQALNNAAVEGPAISYIEAHGTGTSLGDPIEVRALGTIFGSRTTPLMSGSVKTNIGHLEAAAGIASVIKVILALQHEEIPPHLHFREPNPHIEWDKLPVVVPTQVTPWLPEGGTNNREGKRLAGVSSFGLSGTNAHLILEQAPPTQRAPKADVPDQTYHLLTLSAKSGQALYDLAERYQKQLPDAPLKDICFTANVGRTHFQHRLAVIAHTVGEVRNKLAFFAKRASSKEQSPGIAPTGCLTDALWASGLVTFIIEHAPQVAFFFPEQWPDLLKVAGGIEELYESQPIFRQALERCDETRRVRAGGHQGLLDLLYPQDTLSAPTDSPLTAFPPNPPLGEGSKVRASILFALQYAFAKLWQSWGIKPSFVMGVGVGEVVAACVAGAFSLADGLKLVTEPDMRGALSEVTFSTPQIGLVSSVTGKLTNDVGSAVNGFWERIERSHGADDSSDRVGMNTLREMGVDVVLEIGPQQDAMPKRADLYSGLDWPQLLNTLAQLYVRGVQVDWSGFHLAPSQRVLLPTYPFQRQPYWLAATGYDKMVSVAEQMRIFYGKRYLHPLLGQRHHSARPLARKEIQFESYLSTDYPPYLSDHRVYGRAIVPACAYFEMALAAGHSVFKSKDVIIEDVLIEQALILPEDDARTVQCILTQADGGYTFEIFSTTEAEEEEFPTWTRHVFGRIVAGSSPTQALSQELKTLQATYSEELSVEAYYQQMRAGGLEYGPSFQAIKRLFLPHSETISLTSGALGQIQLPASVQLGNEYTLHPVLLDACTQVLAAALADPTSGQQPDSYLPLGLERLVLYSELIRAKSGQPFDLWSHAQANNAPSTETITTDVQLFNENGDLVARLEGLSLRRVSRDRLLGQPQAPEMWLYKIAWQRAALPEQPLDMAEIKDEDANGWLIFTDTPTSDVQTAIGHAIASRLEAHGQHAILISAGSTYQVRSGVYQINPSEPQQFQRLLAEQNMDDLRGIVHLWSLASRESENEATLGQFNSLRSVLYLVQALGTYTNPPRLWFVSRGAQCTVSDDAHLHNINQAPLWGLARVIAQEHPELQPVRIDLAPDTQGAESNISEIEALFNELWAAEALTEEDQIAFRNGERHVARLVRYHDSDAIPQRLQISEYGILDNLHLAPMMRRPPAPGEVEIQVRASGLNFRDLLNALGMLTDVVQALGTEKAADLPFGGECAGVITRVGEGVSGYQVGDEVIAAQVIGSMASFVTVRAEFVVPKPESLTYEEAATIPTTFLTTYHGLHDLAQIKAGDRVLIHSAAGGVGQAAVQLAQAVGADVFATASTGKWHVLRAMGIQHVMNSRSLEFADEVMRLTNGRGVDVVLNSLTGEFIDKSFEVLTEGGRFVEIGKLGIWDERKVREVRPDVRYFPFDLLEISIHEPEVIGRMLHEVMHKIRAGQLKPLPLKVFEIDDAIAAFRYMQQAKHIGKIVLALTPNPSPNLGFGGSNSPFSPEPYCEGSAVRADASYLITGGLGALGLVVAEFLVEQGARHLVLTGRRGVHSATQQEAIRELEERGATILVVKADITKRDDVARVLNNSQAPAPLRGIVHAAGVLDDGILLQQTWKRFEKVMAPKVQGAWHLHLLSQEIPLDFFVCFSSVTSMLGSPGQGNYAAANAFMDALAHYRQAQGLPALSINWGPWAQGGMAADVSEPHQARWAAMGMNKIGKEQGLSIMTDLLPLNGQIAVLPVNWEQFWQPVPLFERFAPQEALLSKRRLTSELSAQPARAEVRELIEHAPHEEREALLTRHLRLAIAQVLALNAPEQIEPRQRLFDMGLDSLLAVELRNRLETSLGSALRPTLLFDYPTLEALANYLGKEVLKLDQMDAPSETEELDEINWEEEVEELSDEEAETLLLLELEEMDG